MTKDEIIALAREECAKESELHARIEALEKERDALRAKIAAMEQQEPVGIAGSMPGTSGFTVACFSADEVPVGTKLYALPGAKGE